MECGRPWPFARLAREPLVVRRLHLRHERVLAAAPQHPEVVETGGQALPLGGGVQVGGVVIVVGAGETAPTPLETSLVELRDERLDAGWDHGEEDDINVLRDDPVHGGAVVELVERIVLLEDHLAPTAIDHLARVLVQLPGPDVIGGGQGEALAAVHDQPRDEMVALLRRRRPGAEEVRRALGPFVQRRINVERAALGDDDVLDGIAHGAGDAAEHHVDAALLDQPAHAAFTDPPFGCGVLDVELEGSPQQPALGVDVVRHQGGDVGVADAIES